MQNISIDFNQKGYKTINANQCDKETRYVVVHCTDSGIFVPLDNMVYANARTMTQMAGHCSTLSRFRTTEPFYWNSMTRCSPRREGRSCKLTSIKAALKSGLRR